MQIVKVQTPSAQYQIFAGTGLIDTLEARMTRILAALGRKLPKRLFILTSPEIWDLWSKRILSSFTNTPTILLLPAGERHKNLRSVEKLLREMAKAGGDRSSILIAFGGGIVGDVGGFVASSFMRGIDFFQVPSTFLSQVDSSVGGKVGVNLPEGKNLVGAFHHPLAVFADMELLNTLPDRELRAGLFESVKAGMIRDRALLRFMEENSARILGRDTASLEKVIAASIRMKADVVSKDERENGLRMILNLGHTLGHAIESVTGYRKLLHGEAVGWGIIAALHLGRKRRTISEAQFDRLMGLVYLYGPLPALKLNPQRLVDASAKDKKHRGDVRRFILPVGIGDATVVEDVTTDELLEAARYMLALAKALPEQVEVKVLAAHG
ncbi:3-dehydroquinate synthase [Acidicapsa dinghuensis]|uniref:3-dehydroquinate synthase n=1 Tax=Acidicapsa dinghuensis TaxID=2218256 RepID=A0ABW1EMG5_9BACT|nr:3-dehydroquinate synthase [Acidicapsa dinghuensis]